MLTFRAVLLGSLLVGLGASQNPLDFLKRLMNRGNQPQRQEPRGSCNDQAMAAFTCAKDAMGWNEEAKAEAQNQMEEAKNNIADCFRRNGCDDPRPAYEAFKSCVRSKLRDGVVQDFLDCADDRNIDIPPELREKVENMGEEGEEGGAHMMMMKNRFGRRSREENPIMEQIRILIDAKCPPGAGRAVEQCSEAAIEDAMSGGRRSPRPNFLRIMSCKDEISCPCMEDLADRKDEMCGCAEDILDQYTEDDYQQALQECRDEAGVDLGSEDGFSKVSNMVDKFCSRRMPNFGC